MNKPTDTVYQPFDLIFFPFFFDKWKKMFIFASEIVIINQF